MEKRKPHYDLDRIKAAFADPLSLNRTYSSRQGADDLDMDDEAVVAVIQGLGAEAFDTSMTSMADHRIWQDVYKPRVADRDLYVNHPGCSPELSFDQLQGGVTWPASREITPRRCQAPSPAAR
jgi:motility quorum-sensing regulator/GCU-specific mRNA interferase toxin